MKSIFTFILLSILASSSHASTPTEINGLKPFSGISVSTTLLEKALSENLDESVEILKVTDSLLGYASYLYYQDTVPKNLEVQLEDGSSQILRLSILGDKLVITPLDQDNPLELNWLHISLNTVQAE